MNSTNCNRTVLHQQLLMRGVELADSGILALAS